MAGIPSRSELAQMVIDQEKAMTWEDNRKQLAVNSQASYAEALRGFAMHLTVSTETARATAKAAASHADKLDDLIEQVNSAADQAAEKLQDLKDLPADHWRFVEMAAPRDDTIATLLRDIDKAETESAAAAILTMRPE